MKWLVYVVAYQDFEGREIVYVNRRTQNNLEVYHVDRMRDYTEMFWVFISDEDKNFLDWYGPEKE